MTDVRWSDKVGGFMDRDRPHWRHQPPPCRIPDHVAAGLAAMAQAGFRPDNEPRTVTMTGRGGATLTFDWPFPEAQRDVLLGQLGRGELVLNIDAAEPQAEVPAP